ncbi:ABC transporter ATP-binding protein [Thalassotalea agarivorans]|uniref:Iron(III) transport system ATP-binding protein n=1 Tax=Thalassotalea agarivorans TaxID=349064 RepID=A0A1I0B2F0_THASX|nr:ABC transporter ATP-binding protein [Thalassotalea agarivorans]SET00247.1 iron(III) transport system ATP-binding protein [Thalassotalea agarivorans]
MSDILVINELTVELQQQTIIADLSMSLQQGQILGLVGPSGCGKTTLLNAIAGFVDQQKGEIVLDTHIRISQKTPVPAEKRHVGMIFQDYALFPHLTVEKNIAFGIQTLPAQQQADRIARLVELLSLVGQEKKYPHQLSGGQQQRVAIARALATQPKLLLLDEPFSNIDARLRSELMVEMRALLKKLNISAIFVTHNKDEVFTFADQMAVMDNGQILQMGPPAQLSKHPNSWLVADFLQLGSWLPIDVKGNVADSVLGQLPIDEKDQLNGKYSLLLKPQDVMISADSQANIVIKHIGVTEYGFHYIADSLDQNNSLAFKQLSFYSETQYQLHQQLTAQVALHKFVVFASS